MTSIPCPAKGAPNHVKQIVEKTMRFHTFSHDLNTLPGEGRTLPAMRRVLCTRVREIQRIRNQEARTLHTCVRNTAISLLALNF